MCAKWNGKCDPDIFLKKLESILVLSDSKPTFRGIIFNNYYVNLRNIVDMDNTIDFYDKNRIIHEAIFSVAKSGQIRKNHILSEINKREAAYKTLPVRKYRLLTTLSISNNFKVKTFRINNCVISFHKYLPKRYRESRDKVISNARLSIVGDIPRDYSNVLVSVKARSYHQAANDALNAFDLLRGIWNWFENRGSWRLSAGSRKQVNNYVIGPIHTIHDEKGKAVSDIWWFQPEYTGPARTADVQKDIDKIYKFTSSVRGRLKKIKYPGDIEKAIRRYCSALDTSNLDESFLKLWGVLEFLTDNDGDKNRRIVNQASFLFSDREYHKAVLGNLKSFRNIMVHSVSESHDIENYVYQLKSYVEQLLAFHLANKFKFEDIRHASDFLELPSDIDMLRFRISMLRRAIKFMDA